MAMAPGVGYKPAQVQDYKKLTHGDWKSVRFYVRSAARKFYAAVEIRGAAYYPNSGKAGAALFVKATINPNDSPNVEYDPEKDIRRK